MKMILLDIDEGDAVCLAHHAASVLSRLALALTMAEPELGEYLTSITCRHMLEMEGRDIETEPFCQQCLELRLSIAR